MRVSRTVTVSHLVGGITSEVHVFGAATAYCLGWLLHSKTHGLPQVLLASLVGY